MAHWARPISWIRNIVRARGHRPLSALTKRSRFLRTTVVHVLTPPATPSGEGSCGADVEEECYLVDPASSHMLVSKIKPCMSFAKDVFINQERKLGARRRSDTVLVSTINDADQGSVDVAFRTPLAPYEKSKFLGSGGSMVARLKLKGIDGRAPPGVEPAA
ncbi:hypothetical protein LguiB_035868 [Lonicera macranthoides]